jgi:hypothetical protein
MKSKKIKWVGHLTHLGERKGVCAVVVRELEEKRPHRRSRRGLEEYITADFQEIVWVHGQDLSA